MYCKLLPDCPSLNYHNPPQRPKRSSGLTGSRSFRFQSVEICQNTVNGSFDLSVVLQRVLLTVLHTATLPWLRPVLTVCVSQSVTESDCWLKSSFALMCYSWPAGLFVFVLCCFSFRVCGYSYSNTLLVFQWKRQNQNGPIEQLCSFCCISSCLTPSPLTSLSSPNFLGVSSTSRCSVIWVSFRSNSLLLLPSQQLSPTAVFLLFPPSTFPLLNGFSAHPEQKMTHKKQRSTFYPAVLVSMCSPLSSQPWSSI